MSGRGSFRPENERQRPQGFYNSGQGQQQHPMQYAQQQQEQQFGHGQGQYQQQSHHSHGQYHGGGGGGGYQHQNQGGQRNRGGFNNQPQRMPFSQPGKPIQLLSNHYKITMKNQSVIYMHQVDFGERIAQREAKFGAIKGCKEALKLLVGDFVRCDQYIFALQSPVEDEGESFTLNSSFKGESYNLAFTFRKKFNLQQFSMEDKPYNALMLMFLNIIVKSALEAQQFKQIGRLPKFFLVMDKVLIHEHKLEMWPGYLATTRLVNDGIYLNVDTVSKFICKTTVQEQIIQLRDEKGMSETQIAKLYDSANQDVPRRTIITAHNSWCYQIDGLTFDIHPETQIFKWKKRLRETGQYIERETNMVEYFRENYNIRVEKDEPLLWCNRHDKKLYLPTSLCYEAALPDSFTRDRFKMRDLQRYKIKDPRERYERIEALKERLLNNHDFNMFNLQLSDRMAQVEGKVLMPPTLATQDEYGRVYEKPWKDYQGCRIPHADPLQLPYEGWTLVYGEQFYNDANYAINEMKNSGKDLKIYVEEPQYIEIPDKMVQEPEGNGYVRAIRADIAKTTTIAVVILDHPEKKKKIKQLLDQLGIPSQFLLRVTVQKQKQQQQQSKKHSFIFTNLLKQMNAKVQRDLYRIQLPRETAHTMQIGVDVCHEGRRSIVGLTATYSPHMTQHFSRAYYQELHKELIGNGLTKDQQETCVTEERTIILQDFTEKALKNFQAHNNNFLPAQIIVYRDGVGGPSFQEKVINIELKTMIDTMENYTPGYTPKILYIFVDKRINTRFFVKNDQCIVNPEAGTVVDTGVVEEVLDRCYDFYLIPHRATNKTALPVHFKVAYNTTDLSKEQVKTYTYQQCYGYFNNMGSIKVPSSVMYAHKLADYTHYLGQLPNDQLSQKLHYL